MNEELAITFYANENGILIHCQGRTQTSYYCVMAGVLSSPKNLMCIRVPLHKIILCQWFVPIFLVRTHAALCQIFYGHFY